jgi:alkanesulfonate monooxygenase SsuD/methylene tetrahydromethanopterin reductase-like flavin-dependent oxidoreductase (luciferase family)
MAISTSGSRETLEVAGREGFWPLLGSTDDARSLGEMLEVYSQASHSPAARSRARVARLVYVAESAQTALDDLRPTLGRQVEQDRELLRQQLARLPDDDPARRDPVLRVGLRVLESLGSDRVDAITLEALAESGYYLVGDPDGVAAHIDRLFAATGGFGTLLLLCGRDIGTREGRARSLGLFMEHCVPRLRHLVAGAESVEAGVAHDGFQAERGGELLGPEPGTARQRRPGAAEKGDPRP